MEGKGFHLVAKYIALFSWLAVVLGSLFVFMFYGTFSVNAFQSIQDQARADAIAIAEAVDFSGHENIQNEGDQDLPEYKRIFDDLNLAASVSPDITYVYTMRKLDTGEWVFVIDADEEEDENGNGVIDEDEASASPGEVYDFECCPWIDNALIEPTVDEEVTYDVWGTWISGYAPITDETGEVVGIVGVDIAADEFVADLRDLRLLIIRTLALTVLLTVTFGVFGLVLVRNDARKIQRALEIKNEELNRLVKKRTASIELVTSSMVHELRAPLTAVKWGIPTCTEFESGSKEQIALVKDLQDQTEEMLQLVGQLLDVSKLELGKLKLEKKQGTISSTVQPVVRAFTPTAEAKGLSLDMNIERGIPKFGFDQTRVKQVLNNLLSNAIKYTEEGEIDVNVSKASGGSTVRVEVVDTGIGLSSSATKQIFKPFERVGASKEVGTGLGLSIAKGIVEAHGGEIGVESKKGKGSTFWFELPLK